MAEVQNYVVVDTKQKLIVGGPYRWDGTAEWQPPEEGDLMLESEAVKKKFGYPDVDVTGGGTAAE